jgi:class 3 adenylate cyclase
VNAAARLEQQSDPGRILISQSTFELIKDAIPCEQRGAIQVQGIERELMTYWLE